MSGSRRATTAVVGGRPAGPPVRLFLETAQLSPEGRLFVRGWTASGRAVREVQIRLGGRVLGGATVGLPRPDIGAAFPSLATAAAGFEFTSLVAGVVAGEDDLDPASVTATATNEAGIHAEASRPVEHVPAAEAMEAPETLTQTGSTTPDAPQPDAIVAALEQARIDGAGLLVVRGWAVSQTPVEQIQVLIGDRALGNARGRLARQDVGEAYPAYPDAGFAGFLLSMRVAPEVTGAGVRAIVSAVGGAEVELTLGLIDERHGFVPDPIENDPPVAAAEMRPSPPLPPAVSSAVPAPMMATLEDARVTDRGVLVVRGWAVSLSAIEHIHVHIGSRLLGVAEHGLVRKDVAMAHPDYPTAERSGFLLQIAVADEDIAERVVRVTVAAVGDIRRELLAPLAVAPSIRRSQDGTEAAMHFHCDSVSLTEDGSLSIGGWAVCSSGIAGIEVQIGEDDLGEAETGQDRPDVGNQYPQFPSARKAGFRLSRTSGRRYEGEQVVRMTIRGRGGEQRVVLQPVLARPALQAVSASASGGERIRFYLDSPVVKEGHAVDTVRGFLSVAGWAIADAGVARVEILVDGQSQGAAFYGIRREDLQSAMPDRDVLLSGFAMLIPPQVMKRGRHDVTVVVRDKAGHEEEDTFSVEARSTLEGPGPWLLRRKITQAELDLTAAILDRSGYRPRWSLLLPLRRTGPTDIKRARRSLASLRHQAYPAWTLTIAVPPQTDIPALRAAVLDGYDELAEHLDIATLDADMPVAALAQNTDGPALVCVLGAGDRLGEDALLEMTVEAAVEDRPDFLYGDERRVDPADGARKAFFKPDWSPDLLLSTNYIGRPWAATPELLRRADLRLGDIARFGEYDAVLRLTERAERIVHVPRVLGGRRSRPDSPVQERRALQRAMRRRGIAGEVLPGCLPGTHRIKRQVAVQGMVSIIIPTIASRGLIKTTIDSIRANTDYPNYEIICLDNIRNTDDPEKLAWKRWMRANADTTIEIRERFNWSRFNNRGARQARGEYLLFLNDDMEVLDGGWLHALLEHAQRPEVGVVGPQLLYPDGKVQHAGMFLAGRVARHAFRFSPRDEPGTFGLALTQRNVICVTGACMLMRRAVFDELRGFDEAHTVVNNDLDFCLRVRRAGRRVIYTPHATLIHHEMVSRSKISDIYDSSRFDAEWKDLFLTGDPFFSPHLGTDSDDYLPDAERLRLLNVGHPLIAHDTVRRILAVKVDHIGDFILGFPAFQRIKELFPNAELCVLAAKASMALARLEPAIDRVIEFNFFHARSEKGRRVLAQKQLQELHATLAPMRFDIALDLRRQPDTRHILRHTGARWNAGFDMRNEQKWLDVAVEWEGDFARDAKREHVTDALIHLVDAVALSCRTERRVVHGAPAQAEARAALAALPQVAPMADAMFARRLVCVHAGVGSLIRQWPPELYAGLIDLLVGHEDVNVLIIGGPDELETQARVMEAVRRPERVFSLVAKVGLSALPSALLSCDLYVGNNSGPHHIAASLGVPTIGIHSGAVDAAEWGPMGLYGTAITRGMACSPCYLARATDCHRSLACLHKVRVGDVYRLCRRMLTLSRHPMAAEGPSDRPVAGRSRSEPALAAQDRGP